MPELAQKERLQLSLLDRLADDSPEQQSEQKGKKVISFSQLREYVKRDLISLLNTTSFESCLSLKGFEHVARSTLNYGIPDLSFQKAILNDAKKIERLLKTCIKNFEPRILTNSLKIKATIDDEAMNKNHLTFEIFGELWAQPIPIQLFFKTEVDLEKGSFTLSHWS